MVRGGPVVNQALIFLPGISHFVTGGQCSTCVIAGGGGGGGGGGGEEGGRRRRGRRRGGGGGEEEEGEEKGRRRGGGGEEEHCCNRGFVSAINYQLFLQCSFPTDIESSTN